MTRPDTPPAQVREPGGRSPVEINPGDQVAFTVSGEVVRLDEGFVGPVVVVRDDTGREHEVPYKVQAASRIEVWPAATDESAPAPAGTGKPDDDPLYPVVAVEHPLADRIARAFSTYECVRSGDWGAIVSIFPEKLTAPDLTREALRRLARDLGATGTTEPYKVRLVDQGENYFTVTGPTTEIRAALDLYHRVQMGQWSEVMWACPPADAFVHDVVNDVRVRHAKDGAWPDHLRAYIGIAQAPEAARAAYHVHQMLDKGGRVPTFSLNDGPVVVTIDGVRVTFGRIPASSGGIEG